jgi:hypothetical protein
MSSPAGLVGLFYYWDIVLNWDRIIWIIHGMDTLLYHLSCKLITGGIWNKDDFEPDNRISQDSFIGVALLYNRNSIQHTLNIRKSV